MFCYRYIYEPAQCSILGIEGPGWETTKDMKPNDRVGLKKERERGGSACEWVDHRDDPTQLCGWSLV